jgi:signal transduction histidine kinase/integral membrane sensor domain MASE1
MQLALAAASVALAYYLGVQIGLWLTFPPVSTTSVLWPPNSILTAALLLVPVRQWWVCLAAALPVHVLLELDAGMAPYLVGWLFVTNCTEALLAAGGTRLLSDSPTQFNTLRRVAVFIGAAGLAAPILSSFADAAVAHYAGAQSYWQVWRVRTFANTLTELSVVPIAVLGVTAVTSGFTRPRWQSTSARAMVGKRLAEAGLLLATLVLMATWVFGGGVDMPGLPPTPSVLLLPFYFWAAARLGVGGVSAALLATALAASYETQAGHRPFSLLEPLDSLLAVQMYLIVMGMPLMCVAGLLDERRRDEADLSERLRFEGLLSSVSGAFVRQPHDSAFERSLRQVGEFHQADYAGLLLVSGIGGDPEVEWQWTQPSGSALGGLKCHRVFPWAFSRVLAGDTLIVESVDDMPTDAAADRNALRAFGLQAMALLPLKTGGHARGVMSLMIMRPGAKPRWSLPQLRLVAEVLATAAARRQAELEMEGGRQKLASMARLSSMGELTASLAHQLNQPLTGIRNNAEAARRFIDSGRATMPQLRDIVVDIIDDDRRAGDVIKRVREMLARSEWSPVQLDANALVQDVAVLIASDAVLRNVSVSFDFAEGPVIVNGNRIDLEQVLLNVVTNAMDAVADRPVSQRVVMVQTCRGDDRTVQLVVRDRGAGVPAGLEDRIFEPFVTTKPTGMGMGLAVARSLVDNHGGSIRAANHPEGGAVITISLPGLPTADV